MGRVAVTTPSGRQHRPDRLQPAVWSTLAFLVVFLLAHLWRWLELRHGDFAPAGRQGYGSPAAAAAYASWPHGGAAAKCAHLARNAHLLTLHFLHHWCPPDAVVALPSVLALVAMAAVEVPLRGNGGALVALYTLNFSLESARMAGCHSAGPAVACGAFQRTSLLQCPPCSQMELSLQLMHGAMPGAWRDALRLALVLAVLGVPVASRLTMWVPAWAYLAIVRTRYGFGDGPLSVAQAAGPLRANALLRVATSAPMLSAIVGYLGAVLLAHLGVAAARQLLSRAQASLRGALTALFGGAAAARQHDKEAGGDVKGARAADRCEACSALAPLAAAAAPAIVGSSSAAHRAAVRAVAAPDAAAVEAALAAHRVAGRGVVHARKYASAKSYTAVIVKAAMPGAGGAAAERHLAHAMPAALEAATAQAGAGVGAAPGAGGGEAQSARPPPRVHSLVVFPGCVAAAANVSNLPEGADASDALQAALPALLPAQAQLLRVVTAPLGGRARPDACVAADPVCLPLAARPTPVTLRLPSALLRELEAARAVLRVVVSASRSHAPLLEVTVPLDAAWAAGGQLQVNVPPSPGPLVQITLLQSWAPQPSEGASERRGASAHGRDEYLAALPLLALPEEACAEVAELWATMVADWRRELPAASANEATRTAFAVEWSPFALDFAELLLTGSAAAPGAGPPSPETLDMLAYLGDCGMAACVRLLRPPRRPPAAAAAPPDACASPLGYPGAGDSGGDRGSGGSTQATSSGAAAAAPDAGTRKRLPAAGAARASSPPSPWLAGLLSLLRCHPSRNSREREYQAWKAQRLAAHDSWAMAALCLTHAGALAKVASRPGTSPALLAFVASKTVVGCVPALAYLASPTAYRRARRDWWCASALLRTAWDAALPWLVPPPDVEALLGHVQRPWAHAVAVNTLFPLVMHLSGAEQAVVSLGLVWDTRMTLQHRLVGVPAAALAALFAAGVLVAGVCDRWMRREWAAATRARGSSSAADRKG